MNFFCVFELTGLGHLDQFVIAEFVQVLFHLRDGLSDWAEGEVGVDGHCRQLLCLRLGYQHVVGLIRKKNSNTVMILYTMGLHIIGCIRCDIL